MGDGTNFKIFSPTVIDAVDNVAHPAGGLAAAPQSSEYILLVEDEEIIRVLTRRVLEASGYVVYEACNGHEGLVFCQTHQGAIDLLVSDVVMPELGGRELAERALKLRPSMKVLFVSGHTEDVVLKEGIKTGTAFLQKPFTARELAQKVRETLDPAAGCVGDAVAAAIPTPHSWLAAANESCVLAGFGGSGKQFLFPIRGAPKNAF
jgi:CheY-like chemotaxis protein